MESGGVRAGSPVRVARPKGGRRKSLKGTQTSLEPKRSNYPPSSLDILPCNYRRRISVSGRLAGIWLAPVTSSATRRRLNKFSLAPVSPIRPQGDRKRSARHDSPESETPFATLVGSSPRCCLLVAFRHADGGSSPRGQWLPRHFYNGDCVAEKQRPGVRFSPRHRSLRDGLPESFPRSQPRGADYRRDRKWGQYRRSCASKCVVEGLWIVIPPPCSRALNRPRVPRLTFRPA
jgi:hypothetical protein